MGYVVPQTYNFGNVLSVLVDKYFKGEGTVLANSTKTAERQRDDRDYGIRVGLSEAIAQYLTLERVKKFPLFQNVDAVNPWDVQGVLQKVEIEGVFPNEEENDIIVNLLLSLIDGEDGFFAKAHENVRRGKILKGEIKPIPEDREWLEELRIAQEGKVAMYRELVMSAERDPKVNDAPVQPRIGGQA